MAEGIDALVAAIRTSTKYKTLCDDVIRNVGARELAKRRTLREAIDETKNTLHQIGGAYFDGRLRVADPAGDLRPLLSQHASTRERLPLLPGFFTRIFEHIAPPASLLDVASGLNPLLRDAMPIAPGCEYTACDIYTDMMAFISGVFAARGWAGRGIACDASMPAHGAAREVFNRRYDVTFLFKCLTCLEPIDKAAPARLLDAVQAHTLVISYPAASLGGGRDLRAGSADRFAALALARGWQAVTRLDFETELVFVVKTGRE